MTVDPHKQADTPPEPRDEPAPPSPRHRYWGRLRSAFRWLRISVWLLVFVLLTSCVLLLMTDSGLRLILRKGLPIYNDLIPGEIHVGAVDGSLFFGFDLQNVTVADRRGRLLVGVRRLRLNISPLLIIDGLVDIRLLSLVAPELHLRQGPRGSAFLDLAPESDGTPPEPSPPEPPPEPDAPLFTLPVAIRIEELMVDGFHLVLHADDDEESEEETVLVEHAGLRLTARGRGAVVETIVRDLSAEIPVTGISLHQLELEAAWEGRAAYLRQLDAETSLGNLHLVDTRFDPTILGGRVNLTAHSAAADLHELTGRRFAGEATLELHAKGDPGDLALTLKAAVGEARLDMQAKGAWEPQPWAELDYRLAGIDPKRFGLPKAGLLGGEGHAKLKGVTLETLAASLAFTCRRCRLDPVGALALSVNARLKARNADADVKLQTAGVNVTATGALREFEELTAELGIAIPDLGPLASVFLPQPVGGRLQAAATCAGRWPMPSCTLDAQLGNVTIEDVSLAEAVLTARSRPRAKSLEFNSRLDLRKLNAGAITLATARVDATGTPTDIGLQIEATADERNQGSLALRVRPGASLRIDLREGRGLVGGHNLHLTRPAAVEIVKRRVRLHDFELAINTGRLTVEGLFNPAGTNDLKLSVTGFELAWLAEWLPDPKLAGRLDLEAALTGSGQAPKLSATLSGTDWRVNEHPLGDPILQAGLDGRYAEADLAVHDTVGPWFEMNARVPFQLNLQSGKARWRKRQPHDLTATLSRFKSERLAGLVELPPELSFAIDGEAQASGPADAPTATVVLTGDLNYDTLPPQPLEIRMAAEAKRQQLDVVLDAAGPFPLRLQAETRLDLARLTQGIGDPGQAPLALDLQADGFELATLNPLLPAALQELKGRLFADFNVTGTLAAPKPAGRLRLEGGRVYLLNVADPLRDIELSLALEGRRVTLEHLNVTSGRGTLTSQGTLTLGAAGELDGRYDAELKDFQLQAPGLPQTFIDTRVSVKVDGDDKRIKVDTTLAGTTVDVYTSFTKAPKPVPSHPALVFVDQPKAAADGLNLPTNRDFLATIRLADPAIIKSDFMDMSWGGAVSAAVSDKETVLTGELTLDRGEFEFLGNPFKVESAAVTFPPGADNEPFLNLQAVAALTDAEVNLVMRGRVSQPEMKLTSNPAMPEYQIFTLLVTGTVETNQESQDEVQAKAANLGAGLIAYQYPQLQQQIKRRTGIDRVSLSFGDTAEEPIVTVGKRLSRRVYIQTQYHHNSPEDVNRATGMMEFRLAPQWTLETFYGDRNVGGVDVFWHLRFRKPSLDGAPPDSASQSSTDNPASPTAPDSETP